MEKEMKSQPKMFTNKVLMTEPESDSSGDDHIYKSYMPADLQVKKTEAVQKMKRGLVEDTRMMEKNRNSLNRFEALSIHGQTLTGISIGGFDIDLGKAAEKTMEIIPLPPSKLPVIFVDETLNFYHHFFQGMSSLIGQSAVEFIARSDLHYGDDDPILVPLVEDMISSGYEKTDTESILLIKKVFASTFEPTEYRQKSETGPRLKVVANLWGFQYIECGMQMAEVDMKMWFSICYSHYRTSWFNTFKTTGIPAFATQGIRKSRSSTSSGSTLPLLLEERPYDGNDNNSTVTKSRRRVKSSSRSVKSAQRQQEDGTSYQLARWMSGRV